MKIGYDAKADVFGISLRDTTVTTKELAEGITGEYDSEGKLVGLEILDASQRLGQAVLGDLRARGGPMTLVPPSHIRLDAAGRAWIDGTNVKVIEVVLDKIAEGWGPEEIHSQHEGYLSLAQIHAALSYYHDHKAEFDAEIERQAQEYDALLAAQGKDTPLHRKLRALGKLP
jgi:uncharacterized protein YuzE/uncharacterized protein (DUF433 family)